MSMPQSTRQINGSREIRITRYQYNKLKKIYLPTCTVVVRYIRVDKTSEQFKM